MKRMEARAAMVAAQAAGHKNYVQMYDTLEQAHDPALPTYIKNRRRLGGGAFGSVYALDDGVGLPCLRKGAGVVKVG
jgi:hypothetical protein